MWDQYETPRERSERAASEPAELAPEALPSTAEEFPPTIRASGARTGAAAGLAIAGIVIFAVIMVLTNAQEEAESDRSGWYDCIAEQGDRSDSLLTAEDICEIGHQRPEGWQPADNDGLLDDQPNYFDQDSTFP